MNFLCFSFKMENERFLPSPPQNHRELSTHIKCHFIIHCHYNRALEITTNNAKTFFGNLCRSRQQQNHTHTQNIVGGVAKSFQQCAILWLLSNNKRREKVTIATERKCKTCQTFFFAASLAQFLFSCLLAFKAP
jgi:hypothetical protein